MSEGSERVALIDADFVAYQAAFSAETPMNWGGGFWTLHAWEQDVSARLVDEVELIAERCQASKVVCALSDGQDNWRKHILPSYKENRDNQRKPMLLNYARQHIIDYYDTEIWPSLEADDVIGIMATSKKYYAGQAIIVSIDKDLSQIPGRHLRYDQENDQDWIEKVTREQGDKMHMIQTLAGDPVDNYSGCPGVGAKTAAKIVDNPRRLKRRERIVAKGKNAGQKYTEWADDGPADSIWEAVVCQFQKAGMTEDEALQQARVSRILRAGDYNFKTKEAKLWTP